MNEVEVITYRLTNGETITGILQRKWFYAMQTVEKYDVATEFVTPVVFHMDDKGIPAYVTTDEAAYPTIQVFMAHVMGKASHGTFQVRENDASEGGLVAVESAKDTDGIDAVDKPSLIIP